MTKAFWSKPLLLALLLVTNTAMAAPAPDAFSDPALEARAHALQRQLRCPVCKGQSIDESGADLATDLRHRVHELIGQGRSDAEIREYFRARYGDFILMQPPLEAVTWLLWLAPFLVLGGAGAVAWTVVSRAKNARESNDSAEIADF
jgi:cytochrome c-type biogenesis protein CcmH